MSQNNYSCKNVADEVWNDIWFLTYIFSISFFISLCHTLPQEMTQIAL